MTKSTRVAVVTRRTDAATSTRRALLDAAADLLDEGGPAAVTLRAVGAAAGTSRGAPYGHFDGKAHLLAVLAAERWRDVGTTLARLSADPGLAPARRLRTALQAMVDLAVDHRSIYDLMFTIPPEHDDIVAAAVAETQDAFLVIVAGAVDSADPRRTGALLMAGAHGIAGLASAGHLRGEKWGVDASGLLDDLIATMTPDRP